MEEESARSYISWGKIKFDDDSSSIIITELPVGLWTEKYKEKLMDWLIVKGGKKDDNKAKFIEELTNNSTPIDIYFKLKLKPALYKKYKTMGEKKTMEKLKLYEKLSERNMYLFDENEQIKFFKTTEEILEHWYKIREQFYLKRKNLIIDEMEYKLMELSNKVRFIKYVNNDKVKITKVTEEQIEKQLTKLEFDKMNGSYDYLINMSIRILTIKHMNKLDNDLKSFEKELQKIKNTSHLTMWINDLNEIEHEDDRYNDKIIEEMEELVKSGEKNKGKKGKKSSK